MKILITGGAGFIGANFLHALVPRHPEHSFLNVDRLTYAANPLSLEGLARHPNYAFEQVDIAEEGAIARLVARWRPEAVVHFAAESHVDRSIAGPREFLRTNVEGTYHLLEACRAAWRPGTGLFHHVSTDEVYGSLGESGAFTEQTRYDPSSPYSASKAASDHLVRAWHRTFGLPVKITNCSNNYGPMQFPEKLIPLMILNALERAPLPIYGDGRNVRDWLYVADHCRAVWAVMGAGSIGATYNVGGGEELSNLEVVDRVCAAVARETGAPLAELLALRTFVADRPGHDLRYAMDAARIRGELGWRPVESFDSGLRATVRWYLDNDEWVGQARASPEHRRWMHSHYAAPGAGGGVDD